MQEREMQRTDKHWDAVPQLKILTSYNSIVSMNPA